MLKKWIIVNLFLLVLPLAAQNTIYPGTTWDYYATPGAAGWSNQKMSEAFVSYNNIANAYDNTSVMVIYKGKAVSGWGNLTYSQNVHSVRKSLVSALYGLHTKNYAKDGTIDLESTLADLGIQDNYPMLSDKERSATLHDIIRARSGVYHCAAYEDSIMVELVPPRNSVMPGSFWYYNNWDFNSAGAILETELQSTIFQVFQTEIAQEIQMADFCTQANGFYPERDWHNCRGYEEWDPCSQIPAYLFNLSTRDMARFGWLFATGGKWKNKQIVPENWVEVSTTPHTTTDNEGLRVALDAFGMTGYFNSYAYLWWTTDGSTWSTLGDAKLYAAIGSTSFVIAVVPEWEIVVATQLGSSSIGTTFSLINQILEARPASLQ